MFPTATQCLDRWIGAKCGDIRALAGPSAGRSAPEHDCGEPGQPSLWARRGISGSQGEHRGVDARLYPYAPELRARIAGNLAAFTRRGRDGTGLRRAAVAVAVVEGEGDRQEAAFVLTRRVAGLSSHAGQWALPGGRIDGAESVEAAALRELDEEVGLRLGPEAVLGVLDDYPTRSGYLITPVVLWAGPGARLAANPSEVASIHLVPLAELDRPDSPEFYPSEESGRWIIKIYIGEDDVHAPTAALVHQFHEVAVHGRATRVHELDQPVWAWR